MPDYFDFSGSPQQTNDDAFDFSTPQNPMNVKPLNSNSVVGENLFLTNTLPIHQNDNIAVKVGKGTVNAVTSVLAAPSEALRHIAIEGNNLLSGEGAKEIPKNTSFVENVLPSGVLEGLNKFTESHPILGKLASMGIETAVDPTMYTGLGGAKKVLPVNGELGTLTTKELPKEFKATESTQTGKTATSKAINPAEVNNAATDTLDGNTVNATDLTDLPDPQNKIIMQSEKKPFSFRDAWDKFYTHAVNTKQRIYDADERAGKLAINTANTSGIVDHNLLQSMVNKNGEKVGASLKEAIDSIPKGKEESFWTYMSQRHNIDRAREGKPVQANYTPEMSAQAVKNIEANYPEFKAVGDKVTKWIDDFMRTWGVDTGIVDKDVYASLRKTYPNYFPTQREFSELEKSIPNGLSQKFADQVTPVRKATGSERDIHNPVENIMQLVNRTIRTAKYNEVGQQLLEKVKAKPQTMKRYAEIIPVKDGMFANTDNVISVLVDGKPQYLKINDKALLDAMNGLPKRINDIPYVTTLTNAVKDSITGKNPLFGVFNIMRDVPTSYIYGSESNPLKFGADLVKATKQVATNAPEFQRYQAVGGGGANFFNSGDVAKSAAEMTKGTKTAKEVILLPLKAAAGFNNALETAPRLAEFNRVLAKTGDVNEALYAAGEVTVNFGRSGNVTKTLDKAGGMYINAGVQGIDRFFRSFKDMPTAMKTLGKAGVAVTAPDIALYVINHDNPYYQALDNRTKDTFFLIPNEFDQDANGQAKTFIKVPKSRELGVLFGSLFERSLREAEGQDESFKGFGNTVATNFAPANPFENNMLRPIRSLQRNKDFANRAIVPQSMVMDGRSNYLQYDDTTTEVAKKIGELTAQATGTEGLSPKQLDYLMKSYTGIIAQVAQPLATKGGSPAKIVKNKFVSDPLFSNQATTDFYDKLDRLSKAAADKNITEKLPSATVTSEENMRNSMTAISSAMSRGTKQINAINATNSPNKEAQIKQIKTKMVYLADMAVKANNPESMQAVENEAKNLFPEPKANNSYLWGGSPSWGSSSAWDNAGL